MALPVRSVPVFLTPHNHKSHGRGLGYDPPEDRDARVRAGLSRNFQTRTIEAVATSPKDIATGFRDAYLKALSSEPEVARKALGVRKDRDHHEILTAVQSRLTDLTNYGGFADGSHWVGSEHASALGLETLLLTESIRRLTPAELEKHRAKTDEVIKKSRPALVTAVNRRFAMVQDSQDQRGALLVPTARDWLRATQLLAHVDPDKVVDAVQKGFGEGIENPRERGHLLAEAYRTLDATLTTLEGTILQACTTYKEVEALESALARYFGLAASLDSERDIVEALGRLPLEDLRKRLPTGQAQATASREAATAEAVAKVEKAAKEAETALRDTFDLRRPIW